MSVSKPDDLDAFLEPNHNVKKRRGFTIFMIVLISLVVIGAILAVLADIVARNYAEGRAAKEIESSLPTGSSGQVDVKIHGLSVILQALSGSLDDVTLSSSNLVVQKIPLTFTADVSDVPLKVGGTTGTVDASIHVTEKAVNETKAVNGLGGSISLGSGDFAFDKTLTVLGQSIATQITATPKLAAGGLKLSVVPKSASVNGAALPAVFAPALRAATQTVCLAGYVPKNARLTSLTVKPSGVTIDLRSAGLPLTKTGLTATGSCS
ncbi:LmeA family phospholipid-binding protein [Frondihabitans sp. Leaf304]|uniref:LmeA family phospholipid-binding protein n=1 Tax=Frondihabitans sp. Leaf304 TaxID=1736329 RepID=UPI0006FF6458|nr:DUF2993 domain-containing protein [Frondihabitans sp. Leaf304]KQQ27725.1 hypothetical protein ASF54_02835 [Frondihabitans sp. Leaf304]